MVIPPLALACYQTSFINGTSSATPAILTAGYPDQIPASDNAEADSAFASHEASDML
jgi:hypothetical protein